MTGLARGRFAAVLLLLCMASHPAVAQADQQPQPKSPPPLPGSGSDLFRYLLNLAGVRPLKTEETWNLTRWNSEDVILVVIGHTGSTVGSRNTADWLDEIARGGGSVLFLGESPQQYVQPWGSRERQSVFLNGTRVLAPPSVPRLHDSANSPFVVPLDPSDTFPDDRGGEAIWSLFAGLDRVATSSPTYFLTELPGPEYRLRLARFPRECFVPGGFNLPRGAAFALGGEEPHPDTGHEFRYVAMADQDVFSNQLLVEPEADNFELARRTVLYLVDPQTSTNPFGLGRRRCLFIEHGRHVTDFKSAAYIFETPMPLPPMPPIMQLQDKLVDAGNQIIDRVQENDTLNRALLDSDPERQNRSLRNLIGAIMALAAVAGTILLLRRVWTARQPQDIPNPPDTARPGVRNPQRPAGIFDRRQRELERRNDVSEPVRAIVREMFTIAGAPETASPKLPPVTITDAVRRPDTLRKALTELWTLAYGPPLRLTVQRWEQLEPLFLRARRAYADGKWRLA